MSIFTPFRSKKVVKGTLLIGGAIKIAHLLVDQPLYAQQSQRVNIAEVGGVTVQPARCDNSSGLLSTVISIQSTQAQVVASTVSSNIVYVCGWNFTTGDSSNFFKFVQGTSTDCITGEANIDSGWNLSSKTGSVMPNAGFPQFHTSSGFSLCIDASSTGVYGRLTYVIST